jgi:hypothetical protein
VKPNRETKTTNFKIINGIQKKKIHLFGTVEVLKSNPAAHPVIK